MAKKTITVTLSVKEIAYDIQNKAFLTGRSRDTGDNAEQVADIQADDTPEDTAQLMRSIQNAVALLRAELAEWLSSKDVKASNTALASDGDIVIRLDMPSNYNLSAVDTLAQGMHQYVVNTALADWLLITDKDDAAEYSTLANGALSNVREALTKRVRPTSPTEE